MCVFLLSANSLFSEDCEREYNAVIENGKPLIPIVIGKLKAIPWRLRTFQYIQIHNSLEPAIELLINSIKIWINQDDDKNLPLGKDSFLPDRFMPFNFETVKIVKLVFDSIMKEIVSIANIISEKLSIFLGIEMSKILILSIRKGSIIVEVGLPDIAADVLIENVDQLKVMFKEYNLISVSIELEMENNLPMPNASPLNNVASKLPMNIHVFGPQGLNWNKLNTKTDSEILFESLIEASSFSISYFMEFMISFCFNRKINLFSTWDVVSLFRDINEIKNSRSNKESIPMMYTKIKSKYPRLFHDN